jgi:LmbE family N-acetylglucosaminyl deacetylase
MLCLREPESRGQFSITLVGMCQVHTSGRRPVGSLCVCVIALLTAGLASAQRQPYLLEKARNKTILLFTPHPDDDTFCCAGTLAILAKQQNNIHIVLYTNDDKGSYDPEMTSQRLAQIRGAEEEEACRIVGIPKQNIHWLQFHDGMLEYANPLDLVEQVTKIIRTYRPDIVMSIDPGSEYVRWHKTDHRMSANNTIDAVRAAEWHLYFPNQLLHDHLQPWHVPLEAYFYVTPHDANYWVNIDSVADLKLQAATAHVSQFDPSISKYRPDWDPKDLEKLKQGLRARAVKKDGHMVEAYRISGEFNEQ